MVRTAIMSEKEQKEVQYILNLRREAEDATSDRRIAWRELWTLYQNKQDWTAKKDWQSKCFVPKLMMCVHQATAMVKRAVMSPRRLFRIDPKDENDQLAKEARELVENKLILALEESNFANAYAESLKCAFLLGSGITKVLWEDGIKFINIDNFNVFIDPDYQVDAAKGPKYIIEEKEMDLAELVDMAKSINSAAGKKLYDLAEIEKIREDYRDVEANSEERMRRGLSFFEKQDRRVKVTEYWGDIVDEKTNNLKKNQLRVLANDKYVIRSQKNPFRHQNPPYILTTPILYPHRGICGVSLVEPIAKMQYAYNNILNLVIDNLNWSVNKVFEYQPTNLLNPQTLTTLFPGKLVAKHSANPAITEVRTSSVGQDVYMSLALLQSEIEKGTAVTEFLMGTAGGTKTATEAEIKTAQAQGIFDTIARDIEQNSMEPLIRMAFELLIQFSDMPRELSGKYRFVVGGLSLLLVRQEQMQRISEVLTLALQSQTIASMTNIKELYAKLLSFYNLEDILATETQQPNLDQQQQMQEEAADIAKKQVAGMSEEEIMSAAQEMGI